MMLLQRSIIAGVSAAALLSVGVSNAQAAVQYLTGSFATTIWNADTNGAVGDQAANPQNDLIKNANRVYTGIYTGSLSFDDQNQSDTIAGFLNTAIAGAAKLSGTPSLNETLSGGNYSYATLFEFTFTLSGTTDVNFMVTHDDGFSIYQGNNAIIDTENGPTSAETDKFSLTPGTYDLWYEEENGLPAVLEVQVPEPATMAIFGVGLLGLGVISRRRLSI